MALHSANNGKLKHLLNLYTNLYKLDDNLAGDTDVRVESIKSASWSLPDTLSKKQTDFFTAFLDDFYPTLVDQATDLKLTGALFRQVVYKLENSLYTIDKFISYEGLDLRKQNGELVLFVDEKLQTLQDDKFISLLADYSVYESIVKYYAFFSFALNNWASFIEIYGKPVRIGKYKPGSSTEEKNLLKQMVKNLGTDLGAVISENTLIEFADFKNASANANLYSDLLDFCKKSVSKRLLGQTLTTNTERTGSYAQAKVHNMIRQDILQADIRDCSRYLSLICSRLNRLNFSNEDIKISLTTPQHVDLSSRIDIDTKLNNIIQIEPDYWYQTYNIPIPKQGAKIKEVAPQQSPFLNLKTNKRTPLSVFHRWQKNPFSHRCFIGGKKNPFSSYEESPSSSELQKIKSFIKNAKSFKDLQNMPYPVDLYTATANEMYQAILDNYIDTRFGSTDAINRVSSIPVIASEARQSPFPSVIASEARQSINNRSTIVQQPFNHCSTTVQNYFEIDWTLEDTQALNAFRAESFIVAGVSSQTLLDMIKSEAEKAFTQGITFDEFKDNLKLNGFEPENPYYLRTNFNQAVNTARSSAEWKNYQDTKDFFPYLRYVTMNDDAVRDEHQQLNGIVRHIDDPFWDTFLPPNDWGCRCVVEPVTKDEAESDPDLNRPVPPDFKIKEEFKRNPGKDNSLFGDWLSCDDAKNLSLAYPQMSGRNKRLHIFNAGKKHCPDLYTKTYKDLNLKDWKDMKEHKLPELINTDGKTKEELLKIYTDYLNNRVLIDTTNTPVLLSTDAVVHFKTKTMEEISTRIRYLKCIDDVISKADEIWVNDFNSQEPRYYYLKKYTTNICVLVYIKKGSLEYFNFFNNTKSNYMNQQRKGFKVE